MRFIDWFSGIGGFRLGLEMAGGFTCVAHSEIDDYAEAVYQKNWPDSVNLGDLTRLEPVDVPAADMWCGGFPCQPFSVAGQRKGEDDERNLWPVWFRLIRLVRPRYVFAENVPGLLAHEYFRTILGDLASVGYDAEWAVIGAADVGAPHRRDRLWVWCELSAAAPKRQSALSVDAISRYSVPQSIRSEAWPYGWTLDPATVGRERSRQSVENVADGTDSGLLGLEAKFSRAGRQTGDVESSSTRCRFCDGEWASPSLLGRVAHGIPDRVDRLRCLGNAVVPQVVEWIGRRIKEIHAVSEEN